MNITNFCVEKQLCIGCGKCINVCPGGLLSFDEAERIKIKEVKEFGWDGCWKCQRCLAVCPKGAISIFNRHPEDSAVLKINSELAEQVDAIITNRRSCRRYLDCNVDSEVVERIMMVLQNAPTGGNKQLVAYTLIDNKERMKVFHDLAYAEMEKQAKKGIYAATFDEKSYQQMKRWEQTVRPDMLFCGAPHILIPHAPLGKGCAVQDVNIACAYFELLCVARGLGAIYMTYPLGVLDNMADIKNLLEIPENHYVGMVVGFGYPEITYARGVQREGKKIHRPKILADL